VLAEEGNEDEDGPEAVDDAGNGGEKFSEEGDGSAKDSGAEFGEEDGYAQGERDCHEEGEE
jgi:hypothetical protein